MPDWCNTGKDGEAALEEAQKKAAAAREGLLRRLYLPADASCYITMLDDLVSPYDYEMPFTFWEHQLYRNGSWKNWYTCIQGMKHPDTGKSMSCPLCESGDKPAFMAAYTVIDHSKWSDKQGNEHEHEVKLFVAKSAVQKILLRRKEKFGAWKGWYGEVMRLSSDSPNTGDQFEWEKQLKPADLKKLTGGKFKDFPEPPNYIDVFAPKTFEELQKVVSGQPEEDFGDGGEADDDTIRY